MNERETETIEAADVGDAAAVLEPQRPHPLLDGAVRAAAALDVEPDAVMAASYLLNRTIGVTRHRAIGIAAALLKIRRAAGRVRPSGGVVADPAETNRPGGIHQEWSGNRPAARPADRVPSIGTD